MSRTSEASKQAFKRVDEMTQTQKIDRYISEHTTADNMEISKGLNMQYSSVTARLDKMVYISQTHKIIGINERGRSIYAKREASDPLNTRPKTKAEITQDKLTAVMEGVGLTESDVNAFHRNWIEQQIKDKAEAEQFIDDAIKRVEAVDAEKEILKQGKCYDICKNASTVKCFKCSPVGREFFVRIATMNDERTCGNCRNEESTFICERCVNNSNHQLC